MTYRPNECLLFLVNISIIVFQINIIILQFEVNSAINK